MLLSEPQRTDYDLNFWFLGFPVRVHPAFFILPVFLGRGLIGGGEVNAGVGILIVAVVFFISILIHELGHALAFRVCGIQSRVVLYWMGGLAIPERGITAGSRNKALSPNEQIFVSLAGPIAGLLLAALFVGIVYASGSLVTWGWMGPIPLPSIRWVKFLFDMPTLVLFINSMILINIILNLFNLVPIYPLDGGQIARQLFVKFDPWAGIRNSLFVSIAFAVFFAILGLKYQDTFLAIFFGYMAYTNYQMLQSNSGTGRPW